MDELGNILENIWSVQCTKLEQKEKKIKKKINWNKFIWFKGEEI